MAADLGPGAGDEEWRDPEGPDAEDCAQDGAVDEVPCPGCGQMIYEESQKCPLCGEWISPKPSSTGIFHVVVVLIVLLVFIIVFVL